MNRLAFITRILYRLKRRYGSLVDIVYVTSNTVDRATGVETTTKSGVRVQRMIVLPSVIHREFSYDLAYIAAAKNFTYGGFFDTSERQFIVDTKDLPIDFEIKVDDYFVYDRVRYDVKKSERFEENRAYFITGKQNLALGVHQPIEIEIVDDMSLTDEAEATVQ